MSKAAKFVPLKVEDFGLTPEQKKILVAGAQRLFPPVEEPELPLAPVDPDAEE